MDARPVRKEKVAFSNENGYVHVRTRPKTLTRFSCFAGYCLKCFVSFGLRHPRVSQVLTPRLTLLLSLLQSFGL